jgi:hypothetical protein
MKARVEEIPSAEFKLRLALSVHVHTKTPGDGEFIPSTQRYYRRLFLIFNIKC